VSTGAAHPVGPDAETSPGLVRGTLGTREVVFQAISHLGPAIGVIIVAPVIASMVGRACH
jgi:hypothetical protein